MNMKIVRLSAVALIAGLVLAVSVAPAARSQVDVSPSYLPIGVAASGNTSTVWFHEPSSRQTLACQTVVTAGKGLTGIQCVAAKLP
ncbi:hypothetical protein CJ010_16940 [Azoarcus sp. DD4]|uniref:hypothetical protein n=1 Tax=Azoarcus sp. DD4 TaxID=2027405 RepID=UPI00112662FE|nr:hypothetical protein [Azoarcus sp. DD4]QDF98103.1 hypothetical protein CJ010_16940 [Azoarcus sp. DD4]